MLSADTVAAGTALAVAECLRAGITSALDMYFFPEAAAAVAAAAGFRPARRTGVRGVPRPRRPPASTTAWPGPPAPGHHAGGPPVGLPAQHLPPGRRAARRRRPAGRRHRRPRPRPRRRDGRRAGRASTPATAAHRSPRSTAPACSAPARCSPTPSTSSDDDLAAGRGQRRRRRPLPGLEPEAGQRVRPAPRAPGRRRPRGPRHRRTRRPATTSTCCWRCAWPPTRRPRRTGPAACRRRRPRHGDGRRRRALGIDDLIGSIEPGKRADLVVLDAVVPVAHAELRRHRRRSPTPRRAATCGGSSPTAGWSSTTAA